jgi:glycosyltransferase involved in cell wall biosynthesis
MISGVSVVLPAYNEVQAVAQVVAGFHKALTDVGVPFEILVIDDGSTDGTGAAAEAAGARVIASPINLGYGLSLRRGISSATHPHVLICDADGTYPTEAVRELVAYAQDLDMVVAARSGPHFRGRGPRSLARTALRLLASFAVGRHIPDVNSGYRIFSKDVVQRYFEILSPGFSFTTGLTLAMMSDALAVGFITVHYHRRVGESKVKVVRDTLRMFQILVQATVRHNPVKLFTTITLAVWLGALASLVLWLVLGIGALGIMAAAGLLFGIQIFSLGLVAEALRTRDRHR